MLIVYPRAVTLRFSCYDVKHILSLERQATPNKVLNYNSQHVIPYIPMATVSIFNIQNASLLWEGLNCVNTCKLSLDGSSTRWFNSSLNT